MRKVTQEIANAWAKHQIKKIDNTETDGVRVYLHGNLIAYRTENPLTYNFTLAGWGTPTTRERLNGLLAAIHANASFFQKGGKQYFQFGKEEAKEIDSNKIITIRF